MSDFINVSHYKATILLFVFSGLAIMYCDYKKYDLLGMIKEKKVARFLAWINITIAALMFILGVIY